ncbi:hypothetical protein [Sphingobacterium multivorum]
MLSIGRAMWNESWLARLPLNKAVQFIWMAELAKGDRTFITTVDDIA